MGCALLLCVLCLCVCVFVARCWVLGLIEHDVVVGVVLFRVMLWFCGVCVCCWCCFLLYVFVVVV